MQMKTFNFLTLIVKNYSSARPLNYLTFFVNNNENFFKKLKKEVWWSTVLVRVLAPRSPIPGSILGPGPTYSVV